MAMNTKDINCLKNYLSIINSIDMLSEEESAALLEAAQGGDIDARNRFIEANLRLVVFVAKKHMGRGVLMDDLIEEGNIGLMTAINKYDATKGVKFSTFAYYWINMYCGRAVANQARSVRLPVHIIEMITKVRKAQTELAAILHREPTPEEVAKKMDMKPSKVKEIITYMSEVQSLDKTVGEESDSDTMGDFIPSEDPSPIEGVFSDERHDAILKVMKTLTPREAEVIDIRYGITSGKPKTLEYVGEYFGFTRQRALQIESKALEKLRNPMRSALLRPFVEEAEVSC